MAYLTCGTMGHHLAAFHLAQDEPARAGVETHLLNCHDCLAQYLQMKRAFDAAERSRALPSPLVKARLKAYLRRQVRPALRLAPYALVAAAAAAAVAAWMHVAPRPVTPELQIRQAVDSGSPTPNSLYTL